MAWDKTTKRTLVGDRLVKMRRTVYAEQMGLCAKCDKVLPQRYELDHITPLAKGGSDDRENLRLVCIPCHEQITAEQFGKRVKQTIGEDGWPVGE